MPLRLSLIFWAIVCVVPATCQSTQGLIAGRIIGSRNGAAVAGARVTYSSEATGTGGAVSTDAGGRYYLPFLSPGNYNLRAEAPDFQPQELYELVLPVAARLELDFTLRPIKDVWEQGQSRMLVSSGSRTIVTFFGPDVDAGFLTTQRTSFGVRGTLETSISQVVDSNQLKELPLAGRDVYTMLVSQPGVSNDSTTARSLGLSSNGQRPSASNFLLDGLENNNSLVSGPLTPVAPEMIQEYRISTNNFSAEFGRASGLIANAVTRSGSNNWHGVGYLYVKNEHLNANDFQSNLLGRERLPISEYQPGFSVGGPLRKNRLFLSSAWEHLQSRSTQLPSCLALPAQNALSPGVSAVTRDLLTRFPLPSSVVNSPECRDVDVPAGAIGRFVSRPVTVDRDLMNQRVDAPLRGGRTRLMARYVLSRVRRPDYQWSPWKDFVSGLDDNTDSAVLSAYSQVAPQLGNEFRAGFSRENLGFDRAHSEVPYLASLDGVRLPGSPAVSTIQYQNRSWEFQDTGMWLTGRHIVSFGGGTLLRNVGGDLTASRDGEYYFNNVRDFAAANPAFVRFTVDRATLPQLTPAPFHRTYRYNQWFLFAQDTIRINSRLAVNAGIRLDSAGNPVNVGAVRDAVIQPGTGNTPSQRIATGTLVIPSGGDQALYQPNRGQWAPRLGMSWAPTVSGRTLIRAAWGVFYDRPFENIWTNLRNNRFLLPRALVPVPDVPYTTPIQEVMPLYQGREITTRFPVLTYIEPDLKSGYTQSWFAGVQHSLFSSLSAEVNVLGSKGRDLISTDIVNRSAPDAAGFVPYSALGRVSYRANDAYSSYHALTALLRWKNSRGFLNVAYTWGHAIDNQSEVLRNDYFDLNPVRLTGQSQRSDSSAFTIEGNRDIDRGNSDFDQRHNFVFFGSLEIPVRRRSLLSPILRNWRVSEIAAFRSGNPYTVFAGNVAVQSILNNRANLLNPDAVYTRVEVPGGQQLLSGAAFANPDPSQTGNSGRNAFRSPGFWNVDISLSRSLPVRYLGDLGRITLRADAFNVFNHANLNSPRNRIGPGFGIAQYGRSAAPSGLPSLAPLNETSRQVQVMLRLEF